MQYDEFVSQVQHRAQLPSGGAAVRAIHATLQTLGERLFYGEEKHLAAQLPAELGFYLTQSENKGNFDMDEFFARAAMYEGVNIQKAMHHSRVVLSVLTEAISPGEINDVRAQLPEDLRWLFEFNYDESRPQAAA